MLNNNNEQIAFDILDESKINYNSAKIKFPNVKVCITKTYKSFARIKEKRIYFDTLSFGSIKRTLLRFCETIQIGSRNRGYEHFYSDEEKRFISESSSLTVVEVFTI